MPQWFKEDVTGNRYGMLTVLRFVPDETPWSRWEVRCDCGSTKTVMLQSIKRGLTTSCGCRQRALMAARGRIHGQSGKGRTGTYNSWAGMMDRSEWGGHPVGRVRYLQAGIRVDPKWHVFEAFYADMGDRPPGTSLDRIDNAKGYGPGNCRWATRREQALNTSRTARVIYEGKRWTVVELCEARGLSMKAVRARASRRGNDYVAALTSIGVEVSASESAPA
jgi:hypothetical protein